MTIKKDLKVKFAYYMNKPELINSLLPEELLISLIKQDSKFIKYIDNPSDVIVKTAIAHSPFSLMVLDKSFLTKENILLALKSDFFILNQLYNKSKGLDHDFLKEIELEFISYVEENVYVKKYYRFIKDETIYYKFHSLLKNEEAKIKLKALYNSINDVIDILS